MFSNAAAAAAAAENVLRPARETAPVHYGGGGDPTHVPKYKFAWQVRDDYEGNNYGHEESR